MCEPSARADDCPYGLDPSTLLCYSGQAPGAAVKFAVNLGDFTYQDSRLPVNVYVLNRPPKASFAGGEAKTSDAWSVCGDGFDEAGARHVGVAGGPVISGLAPGLHYYCLREGWEREPIAGFALVEVDIGAASVVTRNVSMHQVPLVLLGTGGSCASQQPERVTVTVDSGPRRQTLSMDRPPRGLMGVHITPGIESTVELTAPGYEKIRLAPRGVSFDAGGSYPFCLRKPASIELAFDPPLLARIVTGITMRNTKTGETVTVASPKGQVSAGSYKLESVQVCPSCGDGGRIPFSVFYGEVEIAEGASNTFPIQVFWPDGEPPALRDPEESKAETLCRTRKDRPALDACADAAVLLRTRSTPPDYAKADELLRIGCEGSKDGVNSKQVRSVRSCVASFDFQLQGDLLHTLCEARDDDYSWLACVREHAPDARFFTYDANVRYGEQDTDKKAPPAKLPRDLMTLSGTTVSNWSDGTAVVSALTIDVAHPLIQSPIGVEGVAAQVELPVFDVLPVHPPGSSTVQGRETAVGLGGGVGIYWAPFSWARLEEGVFYEVFFNDSASGIGIRSRLIFQFGPVAISGLGLWDRVPQLTAGPSGATTPIGGQFLQMFGGSIGYSFPVDLKN
jgi:hypothetical protein